MTLFGMSQAAELEARLTFRRTKRDSGVIWGSVGAQQYGRTAAPTALQTILINIPSAPALG